MPRLRNTTSGVVVNVDKATADRLGQGWVSADEKKSATTAKAAPKGRSSKSEK